MCFFFRALHNKVGTLGFKLEKNLRANKHTVQRGVGNSRLRAMPSTVVDTYSLLNGLSNSTSTF